jgi:hypothetical protein
MYIEDLIFSLWMLGGLNRWDSGIVSSFNDQILRGNGLTEKQGTLAVKILSRYHKKLTVHYKQSIDNWLDNPQFKIQPRKISVDRKISVISHQQWGKAIKVTFPYDQSKVDFIRQKKNNSVYAMWDKDDKAWVFNLCEQNINLVNNLAQNAEFDIDEEFKDYLEQANTIIQNIENYVPMLVLTDGIPQFQNHPPQIPQLKTDSILEAVFAARKFGITTFSEEINQYLNSDNIEATTKEFIHGEPTKSLVVDSSQAPMSVLGQIVQHLGTCLFVVPGGSELVKLKLCYDFLKEQGIENTEMSVLFRLPNDTGKELNQFIKEQGINNPISDKIKFLFVSAKIPKTLLKEKKHIDGIINLGIYNTHYSIRDFTKNCPNLIYYIDQKNQQEINFGFLQNNY